MDNLFPSVCRALYTRLSSRTFTRCSSNWSRCTLIHRPRPLTGRGVQRQKAIIPLVGFVSSISNPCSCVYGLSDETVEEEAKANSGPSIRDILSFIGIAIMLVWPWIFFGVVWANGGLQMNNNLSKVVRNHPQATTYFITFISSIISLIIGELFSLAIIRFAQELVTYRKPTRPFHLTVLLAFRRQTWPWGKSVKDAKYLLTKDRWWPALSVIICALVFPHVISSTATLLTPTSFNRTAILTGSELDFSSTDADCLSWSKNLTLNGFNCSTGREIEVS